MDILCPHLAPPTSPAMTQQALLPMMRSNLSTNDAIPLYLSLSLSLSLYTHTHTHQGTATPLSTLHKIS